ncbi:MAG: 50S ribosomal protein L21 [Leptolyngbyaceae cyanobacterium SM2_3_12]|nr:50S ribosomal protein L21 [Leptolyngbyaceae cyanobacterium SM2_3_12]
MTYAIVATGGTQLRVEPGRFYDINRLAAEPEAQVTLDQVLFVNNDGEALVGQPLVDGATVTGTVVSHLRGRKIIVYKMQPKKKTRKKRGHRQELTRLMIDSIVVNGKVIGGELAATATATDSEKAPAAEPVEVEAAAADS